MTLALAIAVNAIAAVGLIGIFVYAMSSPSRLRRHVPAIALDAEQRFEQALAEHPRRAHVPARRAGRAVNVVAAAHS